MNLIIRQLSIAMAAFLVLAVFTTEMNAQGHTVSKLTLEDAERILDAAQERAEQDEWTVAIAIVDNGGHLLAFRRLDGTQIGSVQYSIDKAVSAVYYQRPTRVFQEGLQGGNQGLLTLTDAVHLEGGVPIEHEGEVIGGIGVSGVTARQDGIIANAGIDALGW